ncbi:hypothetical protein Riv7116_5231 [Rivularia sp. PCC 7116]|nr:hypothetical protein [Rivularia sp. PCC 7116]AFY57626.1 hypothetical protein Riv7116_5231 [Rivularia sp. PCC 7116]
MTSTDWDFVETLLKIAIIFITFPENTLLLLAVLLMGIIYSWLKKKKKAE